jgi:outer membrane receptor protein involved in Fe transport
MLKKCLILALVFFMVPALFAGITGKISGIVKDKQTGEPLPGVNIVVEGTTLGASTDIDGYYVIVNVPVGIQELRVSYIGYKEILIYNVRVVADATSRYDFDMEPTVLEVSEVIEITAERELIARDNTASRRVISSEVIESQPVDNVARTVQLTAGYTEGSFRGGRARGGDVKYYVDGVDISNPIGTVYTGYNPGQNTPEQATDLPESAIEEVQVITGGMGPQYDAKNAVVSIVTKSGGPTLSGFARLKMNPSEYGIFPESFGYSASDGFLTGDEAVAEAKKMGTTPDNNGRYASPTQMFVNPHFRRYEMGIGGPISLKSLGVGGGLSFYLNADIFDQGGFFRGQSYYSETYTAKLVYNTASNSSYSMTFLTSADKSRLYSHAWSRIVSTGDTLYGFRVGNVTTPDKVLVGSIVAPDGTLTPVKNYDMLNNVRRPEGQSNLLTFSYKKTVSSKTFYEIKASRFYTAYKSRVYDPATGKPLGLSDFRTLRFADPANSKFFPPGAPRAQLLETFWWIQPMCNFTNRQDDSEISYILSGNLVSQLNENNELRLGVEYKRYDLSYWYESFASGGNEYTSYYDNLQPSKFAAYAEDKIETEGMIINAGLRFDFFDPNAILPENFDDPLTDEAKNPNSDLYLNPRASAEDRIKNPTSANVIYRLAPRIGIAFPITERDVFHINYGHYYGFAPMGDLFNNYSWSLLGAFKYIGNPNLKDEKTISYEAGVEHGFNDNIKIRLTGYYKDIADLVNFKKYIDQSTGAPYWVRTNADYADAKGFEISLETRRWYNMIAQVSYTYQIAKGKNSNSGQAFLDNYYIRLPRTEEFYLDWDVRHTISGSIDYRVPQVWMNSKWLGDWGVNMIVTYNSGRPYTKTNTTPPPYQPAVNDGRYPSWLDLDMKIFKNFPIWGTIRLGAFLEVYNLLNDRTLRTINNTQQYDTWVWNAQLKKYVRYDKGDGTWNDPTVWANPRSMRIGFEVLF